MKEKEKVGERVKAAVHVERWGDDLGTERRRRSWARGTDYRGRGQSRRDLRRRRHGVPLLTRGVGCVLLLASWPPPPVLLLAWMAQAACQSARANGAVARHAWDAKRVDLYQAVGRSWWRGAAEKASSIATTSMETGTPSPQLLWRHRARRRTTPTRTSPWRLQPPREPSLPSPSASALASGFYGSTCLVCGSIRNQSIAHPS
jgi:hypothetical protein